MHGAPRPEPGLCWGLGASLASITRRKICSTAPTAFAFGSSSKYQSNRFGPDRRPEILYTPLSIFGCGMKAMGSMCDIVVSAENNHYMAWQCMLFHYSCEVHLGLTPLFLVHGDEEPLLPGFSMIEAKGGRLQRAPNFRDAGTHFSPRNTIHSLELAESDAEYVMLCEPDMIFLGSLEPDAIASRMKANEVSFDAVRYLRIDRGFERPLREVCARAGIDFAAVAAARTSGGVPHIVPNRQRAGLCRDWSTLTDLCLERFNAAFGPNTSGAWLSGMWGMLLAVRKFGLHIYWTELCVNNYGNPALSKDDASGPPMVHYCYGDESWSKRHYHGSAEAFESVWTSTAPDGTVNGAICRQLTETAAYFGIAHPSLGAA